MSQEERECRIAHLKTELGKTPEEVHKIDLSHRISILEEISKMSEASQRCYINLVYVEEFLRGF